MRWELPLGNGRRADMAAIDRTGRVTLVEVKSDRADFRSDRKWREYPDYCEMAAARSGLERCKTSRM